MILTMPRQRVRSPSAGDLYLGETRVLSPGAVAAGQAAILALPSLLAWYAPRLDSLTNGAAVSTIPDHSGVSGVAAVQGTGANQPLYRASGINGIGAIEYDGVAHFLQADALAASFTGSDMPYSVYAVVKCGGSTGSNQFSWGMGRAASGTPFAGGRISFTAGDVWSHGRRDDAALNKDNHSSVVLNTAPHVFAVIFSGTAGDLFLDGAQIVTASDADVGTMTLDTFSLGALRRDTTGNFYKGTIGDVVICNAVHNAANRAAAMQALGGIYGIAT